MMNRYLRTCLNFNAALAVYFFLILISGKDPLFAREEMTAPEAFKMISETKTDPERLQAFEDVKDAYFREGRYSEFTQFLKDSFEGNKSLVPYVQYYTALARYKQLAYLEEKQKWEEYFDQGNAYKAQIQDNAQKAVEGTGTQEPLHVYSCLLLWCFHRDQGDALHPQLLEELLGAVSEYARNAPDLRPIKDAAEALQSCGEKLKAEDLFRQYAKKLATTAEGAAELKGFARKAYTEGNFDFAQVLFDVYVENIVKTNPVDKVIEELNEIAGLFLPRQETVAYAAKTYDRMEEIGGKNVFNESMTFQRAFADTKAKEYAKAKDIYQDFIKKYPCSIRYDEALFKLGVIYTYVLKDRDKGRLCFEQVIQKKDSGSLKECGAEAQKATSWLIESLYQLGLLSQWDMENAKAREYYTQLIEKAQNGFRDTVDLARDRLKEIEEKSPMEYSLRLFLDVSFKPEYAYCDMTRVDINSPMLLTKKKELTQIYANYYITNTGSMQPEVQYLWSGNTGSAKLSFEESELSLSYGWSGTKEINLVVVSPQGIVDRSIFLLDVED